MAQPFKARLTTVLSSVLFLLFNSCLYYCRTTCKSREAESNSLAFKSDLGLNSDSVIMSLHDLVP